MKSASFQTRLTLFLFLTNSFLPGARAGSATWNLNPVSNDWNSAANWTPETVPEDPADVATFTRSDTAAISLSDKVHLASILFDSDASAYTINTANRGLIFFGSGVVNNSGLDQNFTTGLQDGGVIGFRNNASAGNAVFTNYGEALQSYIFFHDNSTASDATFINNGGFGGGVTWFFDSSTAGNATFFNFTRGDGFNHGVTVFEDDATAGTATIVCQGGGAVFHKQSSAANSTMTVSELGNITFLEHAGAGNATIIANGAASSDGDYGSILFLSDHATAGNATLIANSGSNGGQGGMIAFWYQTRGHKARVEVFGNGTLNIESHNPAAPMTIGSLEGTGKVVLGANSLSIGRNNLDTTFSGLITDGQTGKAGGSIIKAGGGTLVFKQGNDYTGGTTIESGSLVIDNTSGSGTGAGPVEVMSGALGGRGVISGAVTIGTDDRRRGVLEPGIDMIGRLTVQNTLTFAERGTYRWHMDTNSVSADEIAATGVTIDPGALFSIIVSGDIALPIGTVLTVIDNLGTSPISGRFSNLSDGAAISIGSNTFQVNYEGGDGNDLTLTAIP